MDKISGEKYLKKIHEDIISTSQQYKLPWPLLSQVNEEYLGYLQNTDGNFYYQWLALLVKNTKPKLILELGNSFGLSTLMMFSQLPETAQLISIDLINQLEFIPPHVFNDSRLKFYFGNDLNLNIFGNDVPVGIDILFIDTDHTFAQISSEWEIYKHLCNPGAIIVLDDIRMNDMSDFWNSLQYPKLELTEKCHHSGFGFFLYTEEKQPGPLNAYRIALQKAFERYDVIEEEQIKGEGFISRIWNKVTNRFNLDM
ncbi:MAG: class I SAM-dependent methyltransferase [Candidatus Brocadiales bacterium]|nr:class I SAM-dependent methyltransferase [Candidatus Brocadiales bacterium]